MSNSRRQYINNKKKIMYISKCSSWRFLSIFCRKRKWVIYMPLFGRRASFDQQAESPRICVSKRLLGGHTKSVHLPHTIGTYAFIIFSNSQQFPLLGNVLWALWLNEESNNGVSQCGCRSLPDIFWQNAAEEWATGDTAPYQPGSSAQE